jgi:hypothetical protein
MKKFLSFILLFALTFGATVLPDGKAHAQFGKFIFDSTACSASADTATGNINAGYSGVTSLTFSITKVSGTLAGKVYLYASNLGNTYTLLDSATVTNTTGTKDYDFNSVSNATKLPVGPPQWYKYRMVYIQSNGASSGIQGRQLLRGVGK